MRGIRAIPRKRGHLQVPRFFLPANKRTAELPLTPMDSVTESDPALELALERLDVQRDVPLATRNTFGFEARAEYFATATDDTDLTALLTLADERHWPVFILGGGSNLVLTRDIPGLTLRLGDTHIRYAEHADAPGKPVHVTAGAGCGWHELVMDTLAHGYAGLENLSLIPGTVGAAPVQNIGAYGVELVDRFVSLRAWHRPSGQFMTLGPDDCAFAYRDSLLKRERGDWIVVSLTLAVGGDTKLVTQYASLAEQLAGQDDGTITARTVSDAVIAVRQSRLPDPAVIGNAGSFFHNPIVTAETFAGIAREHHGIVSYAMPDGRVKLAAGWLIDRLGYRGARRGAVGVHQEQALVLVNHGGGSGEELLVLVREIQEAVKNAYGVSLTVEPLIV